MKRPLFFSIIGILIGIIIIVVAAATKDKWWPRDDDDSVNFSQQCEDLKNDCLASCFPHDDMCPQDCIDQYEMCRNSGTQQALEVYQEEVDRKKGLARCYNTFWYFSDKCYEEAFALSSNPDGTLNRDALSDPAYRAALEESALCRQQRLNELDECKAKYGE